MSNVQESVERASFQVDLRGLVDVLSHHLYSSPTVFVRELMQNAVDAIEARRSRRQRYRGAVRFEVDTPTRTVTVSDNGIGLSRGQIHEFVSRVGASSKRAIPADELDRFIGQFGIGLLSCFMVADAVVILTRSAIRGSPSLEWRAHCDGTYTLRPIATELAVGTRVTLQLRPDAAEYAEYPRLVGLVRRYGQYLEHEVTVECSGGRRVREKLTGESRPWAAAKRCPALNHYALELGFEPLDTITISDATVGLEAVAFVLSEPCFTREGGHRLYLKSMFVTDADVKVMPPWASFVRCVINSTQLRPTASRESVVEDTVFHATKAAITAALSRYLHGLGRTQPQLLARILSAHDEPIRQLAREDEEFFKLVIDLLPFETSCGTVRFGEYRAENLLVRLAPTVDQFRACAAIAAAQGLTIFNGGYSHHSELLERAVALDPSLTLEIVDARLLIESLAPTGLEDSPPFERLLDVARDALAPFACGVQLRAFDPDDIPAVFVEGPERSLERSLDAARQQSKGVWTDILDSLRAGIDHQHTGAFLVLNTRCALLTELVRIESPDLLGAAARVLYVQALLLGRQPLTDGETREFAGSLAALVRAAVHRGVA